MADNPAAGDPGNLEKVLEVVYLYHGGNRAKVDAWLREPHAQLGGETPIEMIRTNRLDLLVDLLRMMVAELDAR
jgi:hypothetical protein